MIPEFPEFKKLELSDKIDIEKFTLKFPPYSDFNFISMWSWDIAGELRLSVLNKNLVVRFTDYLNSSRFYSFLGDNDQEKTASELIKLAKVEGLETQLKLIPEDLIKDISESDFIKNLDRDAFDYIYSVDHLANMHNWAQHTSGKNIRNYHKSCTNYTVNHLSIAKAPKDDYLRMFQKWAETKDENYEELNEYTALERIFEIKQENLKIVSIFVDNILVGFTIYEIISPEYAISHFAKSDLNHDCAVSDLLNWEEAKILKEQGIKYFNWEQDLGIPGLRKSKEKYKPEFFLKKILLTKKPASKGQLYLSSIIGYNATMDRKSKVLIWLIIITSIISIGITFHKTIIKNDFKIIESTEEVSSQETSYE